MQMSPNRILFGVKESSVIARNTGRVVLRYGLAVYPNDDRNLLGMCSD